MDNIGNWEEQVQKLLSVENRCFESTALVFYFFLQHVNGVNKLLGARRAPWDVHIDGNELVDALHDGVVIEYTA